MIIPKKWHLYILDLEPRVGTKPGKQRPCLCIQPSEFCAAGLGSALVVPLTTNLQTEDTFPIRVRIPKGTCGLEKESEALIEQILAWDTTLFKKDLGKIPEGLQEIIKAAIKDFLDL
ncbi:MAG: type II toxin-antitoxin system PemK/MazF family toxin [Bdellovibrionales bacterium]|jgi:mRNA interferase MazF|nr:type II toxin-antitoxin system PemK/MazF family toxin [Bdellovibrionales bacterium]MBL7670484.1 type II toxin-antitoxin system PemK/MazF family toxin [Pseudobdellovibrionaceae bacterium]